jgi:hypothetical protein
MMNADPKNCMIVHLCYDFCFAPMVYFFSGGTPLKEKKSRCSTPQRRRSIVVVTDIPTSEEETGAAASPPRNKHLARALGIRSPASAKGTGNLSLLLHDTVPD